MQRQNIIIITHPNRIPEAWGNFKKACEAKMWKYNTLCKLKMPIEHEGHKIYRVHFL